MAKMCEDEKVDVAYVTKYALTEGVIVVKDAELTTPSPGRSYLKKGPFFLNKSDWAKTEEEAQKRAREMKVKKIAALKKQLKALETDLDKPVKLSEWPKPKP